MQPMNKIWLIIKREYLNKVKKKSFLIMTIFGPILFAGLIIGAVMLAGADTTQHTILLADELGNLIDDEVIVYESQHVARPRFNNSDQLTYDFRKGVVDPKAELATGAYTAVIQLSAISYTDGKVELFSEKAPSMTIQNKIRNDLEDALELYRARKNSIPIETYKSIRQSVDINIIKPSEGDKKDHTSARAFIGFAFAIIIYFFIFFYGVQVMRGVMEEKTNRIVEVIISSVKPFQLMMGKVIGIGLVGLTQFVIWVTLTSVISSLGLASFQQKLVKMQMESMGVQQQNGTIQAQNMAAFESGDMEASNEFLEVIMEVPWVDVIISFIIFFVGGYLLYASLFAAIGAMVDNETDTQQFMMPVTIPLLFAYIVSAMMIDNPEGSVGTIFSIFPLTSPVVMMVKTAIGVSIWLKLLSIVVLIGTFVFFIWVAGRIYRVGILMYGKKPTYRELWKWMKYKG
jgi:ABC-2 type transport system permease protein